jgi:hypothetical protein
MKQSDGITELTKALVKAQSKISGAKASGTGQFDTDYSTLADIWIACRAALPDNGLAIIQAPGLTSKDDTGRNHLHLTTRLLHESGEWIEEVLSVPLAKVDPQGFGSALTYARRYALAAMVGVVTYDDDAQLATEPPPAQKKAPPPVAQKVEKALQQNGQPEHKPNHPLTWADEDIMKIADLRASLESNGDVFVSVVVAAVAATGLYDTGSEAGTKKRIYNVLNGADFAEQREAGLKTTARSKWASGLAVKVFDKLVGRKTDEASKEAV